MNKRNEAAHKAAMHGTEAFCLYRQAREIRNAAHNLKACTDSEDIALELLKLALKLDRRRRKLMSI